MTFTVAVDLDDVVVDFINGVYDIFNETFGTDVRKEDAVSWKKGLDQLNRYAKRYGCKSAWAWVRLHVDDWANMPAVPGAIGGLTKMRRDGHILECVTHKPDWAAWVVHHWLAKWREPLFHRVTIIGSDQSKAVWSDADILIDDKVENCRGFLSTGRYAVLFTQPWNADEDITKYGRRAFRADNWAEVIEAIDAITAEEEAQAV